MSALDTSRRVVCLGEALVDFVCERPVARLAEADCFVPRPGGSLPNIAVSASRFGASVEILGGAGDDDWGRWARERIAAEGVDVDRFALLPGVATSHAFVAVAEGGEPSFAFFGDRERPAARAAEDIEPALDGDPGVLVVGSDTLLGEAEREVTMRAATLASQRGWQVLCDPNLRPARWPDQDSMTATIRELVALSTVVKLSDVEVLALTGVRNHRDAAAALRTLGPAAVAVTSGGDGAFLVSDAGIEPVAAFAAEVVDATGAGDSVAGVLTAALAHGAKPTELSHALRAAMVAAAGVVSQWGAWDGLPSREEAAALLRAA